MHFMSGFPDGGLEINLVIVEVGGQKALEQLEGHDGGQAPDGMRWAKVDGHTVTRLALKRNMMKLIHDGRQATDGVRWAKVDRHSVTRLALNKK
jgi:hypothetical protein